MAQAFATFVGYVDNIKDVDLLLDACVQGFLPLLPRRLQVDEQSTLIKSGSIFIYDESASNIKRWTDGRSWSPRRSLGDFYIYHELEKKGRAAKKGGLVRKMISHVRDGVSYGLVSYFTDEEVHRGMLTTPTTYIQLEIPVDYEEVCCDSPNLQDTWGQLSPTLSLPSVFGWETPWVDRDANLELDEAFNFGVKEELSADYFLFEPLDLSQGI